MDWNDYLEPIGLGASIVLVVLFVTGIVLQKPELITMLTWTCLLLFPVLLVGLAVCMWLNREAKGDLRRIVTELSTEGALEGAK